MHAGTEQLLTLRDGGPIDAAIAQHVTGCRLCTEGLAELADTRDKLRQMPQLSPPDGAWQDLQVRLEQPAVRRYGWLGGAVAAAVSLMALAIWQSHDGNEPDQPTQLAATQTVVTGAGIDDPLQTESDGNDPELDGLLTQSRRLEQVLRAFNNNTPRVMNAGLAGTIADLQDGIAYIDYGLSYDDGLNDAQSEQLWRQRVGLMNTLVQVRGAQLQQISN